MVTVVSMYQTSDDGSEQSITPFGGEYEITGSTWPGTIWQNYMLQAIGKVEVKDFDWYRPDYRESVFNTYTPPTGLHGRGTGNRQKPNLPPSRNRRRAPEPEQPEEQPGQPEDPGNEGNPGQAIRSGQSRLGKSRTL